MSTETVCFICDSSPMGYINVVDRDNEVVGRVCSSHTLWEVLRTALFDVRIEYNPEEEDLHE